MRLERGRVEASGPDCGPRPGPHATHGPILDVSSSLRPTKARAIPNRGPIGGVFSLLRPIEAWTIRGHSPIGGVSHFFDRCVLPLRARDDCTMTATHTISHIYVYASTLPSITPWLLTRGRATAGPLVGNKALVSAQATRPQIGRGTRV